MTDIVFGQPWHGKLTPEGLVLADGSVKTTMSGNDSAGVVKTYSYHYPGAEQIGHTQYVKVPGLPPPTTPPAIAALGGEFKNDAILYGSAKWYSPFSSYSSLNVDHWVHYGSDGVWRRMRIVVLSETGTSVTVRITRHSRFGYIGGPGLSESITVATLTLTHARAVSGQQTWLQDARFDGRQIVITRTGTWSNSADYSLENTNYTVFENKLRTAIVAAWRIDLDALAESASAELVWEWISDHEVMTPAPEEWSVSDEIYYTYSSGYPGRFDYYEKMHGCRTWIYSCELSFERLLGAAFTPSGQLVLPKFTYSSGMTFGYTLWWEEKYRGYSFGTVPVLPSPTPSGPNSFHPYKTEIHENVKTYEINITGIPGFSMLSPPVNPVYAKRMTNNVFDLTDGTTSLCRVGPGVADLTERPATPLYASYNPRANEVVSSATPIGFV